MDLIRKITVKYLVSTESSEKIFFASLLTMMKKQQSKETPTMGVTIRDGQLYLLYNNDFVENIKAKYGFKALKGILEHELLHIVYDHLSKIKKFNRIPYLYNIASDMAINQMIDNKLLPDKLPIETKEGTKWVGKLVFPESYKLPVEKNAEFYYNQLMKQAKKQSQKNGNGKGQKCPQCGGSGKDKDGQHKCPSCGGSGKKEEQKGQTLDDHSQWKNIKENEQMTKEVVKRAVKGAYKNAKKMRGHLPAGLEEAVNELLKPPTINWKQLLKQYIGSSIKTGFKSSWKRPNRRFPFREDYKGKTAKRTIKMMVAVDTSGSVCEEDFLDFIGELKGILNVYKCKIDLVHCDAEIQKKEPLKPYSDVHINFKGRGGTSFKPVFKEYRNKSDYDLLIYFTDGYGDQEDCRSNKQVIWVLTKDGSDPFNPAEGRIVRINNEK
jgi:predicted metal-dependent peptidase